MTRPNTMKALLSLQLLASCTTAFVCTSHAPRNLPSSRLFVPTTVLHWLPPSAEEAEVMQGKLSILEKAVEELLSRVEKQKATWRQREAAHQQQVIELTQKLEDAQVREQTDTKLLESLEAELKTLKEKAPSRPQEPSQSSSAAEQQEAVAQLATLQEQLDGALKREQEQLKEVETLRTDMNNLKKTKAQSVLDVQESLLDEHSKALKRLQAQIETLQVKHGQEIQGLQRRVASKESELTSQAESSKAELEQKQTEIKDLTARLQTSESNAGDQAKLLKQQLDKSNQSTEALQTQVSELQKEAAERKNTQDALEERVEIASAAVHAAEKREKLAAEKLQQLEANLKKYQLVTMVQRLSLQALEASDGTLAKENEELIGQLKKAEERAASFQMMLQTARTEVGLLARLKKLLRMQRG